MVEIQLISIILWSITASLLVIFIILSLFIFRTNSDKTFKYYAFYCFFLLLYVVYKFDFYPPYVEWLQLHYNPGFNWMVQVAYHAFYMMFGIRFLEFHIYYPLSYRYLNRYSNVLLFISIAGIFTFFLPYITSRTFDVFFLFIFLPVHLSLAVFIIIKSLLTNTHARYYFTMGSFLYMLLAMVSLLMAYKIVKNPFPGWIYTIDFFFMAIILEGLVFSYGLSYRIRLIYNQRLTFQKELEKAQQKIQENLKEKISLQQKENLILVEQKQKQELITKVAYLQQKVLRSQINSHFIFNVLNSIKLFILQNDAQKASMYLGKFARFIRSILDTSIHDITSLADELNTLDLYLNIEQMRFNDKFSYNIDVPDNINLQNYPIPPLLLQPLVENAIWHGMMQAEKSSRLNIRIIEIAGVLKVEIEDNGIGYRKSISNKKQGHKSMGLNIVKERIEHHNQRHRLKINYSLLDKSDYGEGNGTIVVITFEEDGSRIILPDDLINNT